MLPTNVVVGLHQNGLGVVRALGRSGVPVIAVDEVHNRTYGATRYVRRASTPDLRGPGLIDTLESLGKSLAQRGVLTLTLDRSVLLVSEHRARLEPYFAHSLPSHETINTLMHKSSIDRFARQHGFHVPRTYSIGCDKDLEQCAAEISLPCILKPEVKTVAFVEHSPKKAFFVRSLDELRDTWNLISQWEPGAVVQEWIPGPDSRLVFCLFYFDANGRPLASFVGRKIRQYIPRCGTACSAERWDDDIAYTEGVRFFQAARYRGFGAIEFKVAPDGRYFLVEPTVGRTEHIFALAAANGINLPYAGYRDMAGLPPEPMAMRRVPVVYIDWKRDFRAARLMVASRDLTWPGWIGSVTRLRQHAIFAWDDPLPLFRHVEHRGRAKVRTTWTRVRRAVHARLNEWREPTGSESVTQIGAAAAPREVSDLPHVHIQAALAWLCAAQDSARGGVARAFTFSRRSGYHLGWQPAYPETTGYIIPTFFDASVRFGRDELVARAIRMADWELTVQHESGGFPGGTSDRRSMPVVFNTGMVLLGLTRAYIETRQTSYKDSVARAATFLSQIQSADGAWRRFVNMNGATNVHAYDCLVSYALIMAAQALGDHRWADTARRNLEFTLTLQAPNGWFSHNALRPARNSTPLTHTIGYAASGLLESGLLLDDARFVDAAELVAESVLQCLRPDGFLAGELRNDWSPASEWSCLTGAAQMAILWWRLYELRQDPRYALAAQSASGFVTRRQELQLANPGVFGGIAGSFPVHAPYGRGQFLNWATKFLIDALLLEEKHTARITDAMDPARVSVPTGVMTIRR